MSYIAKFTYHNHKGEVEERKVDVERLEYIRDPGFNYKAGWFLSGTCLDRNQRRSFALDNIVLPEGKSFTALQIKFGNRDSQNNLLEVGDLVRHPEGQGVIKKIFGDGMVEVEGIGTPFANHVILIQRGVSRRD